MNIFYNKIKSEITLSSRTSIKVLDDLKKLIKSKQDVQLLLYQRTIIKKKQLLFFSGNKNIISGKEKFIDDNKASPIYLSKYNNCYLFGKSSILTNDNKIAKDCILNNRYFNENIYTTDKGKLNIKTGYKPIELVHINTPVLALTSSGLQTAYTHWFTEILTRISVFDDIRSIKNLKIIVDFHIRNYQLEQIYLLGISENQIVKNDDKKVYLIKELYLPGVVGLVNFHNKAFDIYNMMKENFDLSKVSSTYKDIGSKIFIYRKELGQIRRSLLNLEQLSDIANEKNYHKIYPEEMNIHEKIYVFGKATHIIGEAGGGMTNIVFSNNKAKIMILASDAFPSPIFTNIQSYYKFELGYIFGTSIEDIDLSHDNNSNFIISVKLFIKNLKILEK